MQFIELSIQIREHRIIDTVVATICKLIIIYKKFCVYEEKQKYGLAF